MRYGCIEFMATVLGLNSWLFIIGIEIVIPLFIYVYLRVCIYTVYMRVSQPVSQAAGFTTQTLPLRSRHRHHTHTCMRTRIPEAQLMINSL